MSVARRKDGRYIVKYRNAKGEWAQRSFKSEQEAMQFDGEAAYDDVENERPTLLECVLVFLKNTKHSEVTKWHYRFAIIGHDKKDGTHTEGPAEMLANRYADTLTFRDLNAVRDNCRARKMCDATINQVVGRLKAALNWCARHDVIESNPWGKYGQLEAVHKSRMGTMEEIRKIFACLPAWMQWAAKTCLALCLRPGLSELFGLRWAAFQWTSGTVTVHMGKVGRPKTVYPPREYMGEALIRFEQDGRDCTKLVCRNSHDKPVCNSTYIKAWNAACKAAGVKLPMYSIRHAAASAMLEQGADLAAVAAQLGHADASTTTRFYLHAMPDAQRRAGSTLALVQLGAAENSKSK